jgi:hypothetical protein
MFLWPGLSGQGNATFEPAAGSLPGEIVAGGNQADIGISSERFEGLETTNSGGKLDF